MHGLDIRLEEERLVKIQLRSFVHARVYNALPPTCSERARCGTCPPAIDMSSTLHRGLVGQNFPARKDDENAETRCGSKTSGANT